MKSCHYKSIEFVKTAKPTLQIRTIVSNSKFHGISTACQRASTGCKIIGKRYRVFFRNKNLWHFDECDPKLKLLMTKQGLEIPVQLECKKFIVFDNFDIIISNF